MRSLAPIKALPCERPYPTSATYPTLSCPSLATIPRTMVRPLRIVSFHCSPVAVAQGNQDDHHDAHVTSLRILLGSILSPVSKPRPA